MEVRIISRAFSNGFDITTPSETFSVTHSPFGELLVINAHGTQIARVAQESLLGHVYDIIISGGELYQFDRDKTVKQRWTCSGGGRTIQLSEEASRHFIVESESQRIAECSVAWFSGDYTIALHEEAEFKLVVCIFLAHHLRENRSSGTATPA